MNQVIAFSPSFPRDGRRGDLSRTVGSTRRTVKNLQRSSGSYAEEIAEVYRLTGTITDKRRRGRMTNDRAITALEACVAVSRHLAQGNDARAWMALVELLQTLRINDAATLRLPKNTPVARVFLSITQHEGKRPQWTSLPLAVVDFYAALGVELRPIRVQLGLPDREPSAEAQKLQREIEAAEAAALTAAGFGGAYDMSAEEEGFDNEEPREELENK